MAVLIHGHSSPNVWVSSNWTCLAVSKYSKYTPGQYMLSLMLLKHLHFGSESKKMGKLKCLKVFHNRKKTRFSINYSVWGCYILLDLCYIKANTLQLEEIQSQECASIWPQPIKSVTNRVQVQNKITMRNMCTLPK